VLLPEREEDLTSEDRDQIGWPQPTQGEEHHAQQHRGQRRPREGAQQVAAADGSLPEGTRRAVVICHSEGHRSWNRCVPVRRPHDDGTGHWPFPLGDELVERHHRVP
jgi:hypothetical protein